MTDVLGGLPDKIKEVLSSEDLKKALPYLLAGGAGATAGALATGGRKDHDGESRIGHLGRVLRNALVTGGLAAGGTALVTSGLKNTLGSMDSVAPKTGIADNEGPLASMLRGAAFSPATAVAAGGLGLAASHSIPGIGANHPDKDGNMSTLVSAFKDKGTNKNLSAATLNAASPEVIAGHVARVPSAGGTPTDKLRRIAGLASGGSFAPTDPNNWKATGWIGDAEAKIRSMRGSGGFKGGAADAASKLIGPGLRGRLSQLAHNTPLNTLGHTRGRRIGRGALGLSAAALPSLIGAFLTDDPNSK